MTLTKVFVMVTIAAVLLTLLVKFVFKKDKNLVVSFAQNFAGAFFLFSGWVKAVDPLGTAYKMENYFAEFEYVFSETWISFIAPIFPFFSSFSTAFSVTMIVFEIVLGLMLILGNRPKLTAWLFMGLVAFFTVLTGFTYLTGYVPNDANFFEFGKWGAYDANNMKVTDCGCFGDFLKLEPFTSFKKDLFLLIPAFIFVFGHNKMHQLFTNNIRFGAAAATLAGITLYCFTNFYWDIPKNDFRPFKVDADVAKIKAIEEEAAGNVKVIAYDLVNKSTGEVVNLPYDQFLKKYKDYPKAEWEYSQIKSEPTIEETKISHFAVEDLEGNDVTEELLNYEGYSVMVVCYKLKGDSEGKTVVKKENIIEMDTIFDEAGVQTVVQKIVGTNDVEVREETYDWDKSYQVPFTKVVNPFMEAAEKAGLKVYAVAGAAGAAKVEDFRHATQTAYPFYEADDILLKTIVRSNPGIVLWKDGKIIQKWHHKKLPAFNEVQTQYIK